MTNIISYEQLESDPDIVSRQQHTAVRLAMNDLENTGLFELRCDGRFDHVSANKDTYDWHDESSWGTEALLLEGERLRDPVVVVGRINDSKDSEYLRIIMQAVSTAYGHARSVFGLYHASPDNRVLELGKFEKDEIARGDYGSIGIKYSRLLHELGARDIDVIGIREGAMVAGAIAQVSQGEPILDTEQLKVNSILMVEPPHVHYRSLDDLHSYMDPGSGADRFRKFMRTAANIPELLKDAFPQYSKNGVIKRTYVTHKAIREFNKTTMTTENTLLFHSICNGSLARQVLTMPENVHVVGLRGELSDVCPDFSCVASEVGSDRNLTGFYEVSNMGAEIYVDIPKILYAHLIAAD